jgi:uncharacterized protein
LAAQYTVPVTGDGVPYRRPEILRNFNANVARPIKPYVQYCKLEYCAEYTMRSVKIQPLHLQCWRQHRHASSSATAASGIVTGTGTRRRPWFQDDNKFNFKCTACGKCCRGKTNVFINEAEIRTISSRLGMHKATFMDKYTDDREEPDGTIVTSLKTKTSGEECVFLDQKGMCSIYDVRPTHCRTYPFWPQLLLGPTEWETERSRRCEGINQPKVEGSYVDKSRVIENLIIHQVHARGNGPNFTYEESVEYLGGSMQQEPTLADEFERDFFSTHFSELIYEDDQCRIVDVTLPDLAPDRKNTSLSIEADHRRVKVNEEQAEDDEDDDGGPPRLATFRRLEFLNSPEMAQTEVQLCTHGGGKTGVDHSVLTFPVHRALAGLMKDYLSKSANHTSVLLLGAGGCALPMHILTSSSLATPLIEIDAIEPLGKLYKLAEKYFGAKFNADIGSDTRARRLRPFVTDALEFLQSISSELQASSYPYHMVVVDAFESASNINQAPPQSFLTADMVHRLAAATKAETG